MKKNLLLALGLVLLLVGLFFLGRYFVQSKIDSFLKKEINAKLGETYTFDYQGSEWRVFDGSLAVKDLLLKGNSTDSTSWKVEVDRAEMFGFNPWPFITEKVFRVDSVLIHSPSIKITNFNTEAEKDGKSNPKNSNPAQISFGKISLSEGHLVYDPDGPEHLETKFRFETTNFSIDKSRIGNVLTWENAKVELDDVFYQFGDSIYTAEIEQLNYGSQSGNFTFSNTRLSSRLNIAEFSREHGWRKGMFAAEIPKIVVSKPVNFSDSIGFIPMVELFDPRVNLKKDLRFPLPDRITELPQTFLATSKLCFEVDTVRVNNGAFSVNINHDSNGESEITFEDVNANLSNFQNTKPSMPAYSFSAEALFMGEANLNMKTSYHYGNLNPFNIEGRLSSVSLSFMDEFLQRSAGVEITEGKLKSLEFKMNGNDYGVSGDVEMRYENLKLDVVDKETREKKKFLSKLADLLGGLVFWKENPDKSELRIGIIKLERDVRKGFAAQWVDGLLDGVISTILRIDPEKLERTKQKIQEKRDD